MAPSVKKSNKRSEPEQAGSKRVKKARISVESSEDELDELDDLDVDEEESGEEKKEEGADLNNHGEQRKLLKERKMQRSAGSEIAQIKPIWEKLRCKTPPLPVEIREKLCNEIWEIAKDHIADLVLKHDASRVVQTLVKFSNKERRELICKALTGKFYQLATSSYGKYLLVKLLHYGSRTSRQSIIDELHGGLRKLMRHREGAYVVEDLFVLYSTHEQRQQMIREFWGSEYAVFRDNHGGLTIEDVTKDNIEKRNIISRNLMGTITASVEKGSAGFQILHAAMKELVKIANDKETSELIELLHEQFAELVHTPEGCFVACTLIAKATAKERKSILKTLKNHASELIKNEHGNLVFITLLMCVDDTVLVFKTFNSTIKEFLNEFIVDKYGRRPFLYMLLGLDGKYFSPIIKKELTHYATLSANTSKKDPVIRKHELLDKFAPVFLNSILKNYSEILLDNFGCQFVAECLSNDEFYKELNEEGEAKFSELIETVTSFFKGDITEEDHPIHKPFSARLLKSLIQGGKWNNKLRKLEPLSYVQGLGVPFATKFYEDIIDSSNLLSWINEPDSSFTIVALYESFKGKNEDKQFMKDLKSVSKKIEESDSNKGARLLLKLMGQ